MKLILSFPGGGMRGEVQARIVSRMPSVILRKASMFAGTSTGGLIAIGLGLGKSPVDLEAIYLKRGQEIFNKSTWRKLLPAFYPKYSTSGIQKVLEDVYGAGTHFQACTTLTMCNAYDRCGGQPFHFKSWHASSASFLAHEVGRATSAAPTYFESFQNRFWDGGICSNDPALDALAEARLLWPGEDIVILSIGNGRKKGPDPFEPGPLQGFAGIAKELIDALLNSPDESTQYRMSCLMAPNRYFHIDADIPASVNHDMDDASPKNVAALQAFGDALYEDNEHIFQDLAEVLVAGQV